MTSIRYQCKYILMLLLILLRFVRSKNSESLCSLLASWPSDDILFPTCRGNFAESSCLPDKGRLVQGWCASPPGNALLGTENKKINFCWRRNTNACVKLSNSQWSTMVTNVWEYDIPAETFNSLMKYMREYLHSLIYAFYVDRTKGLNPKPSCTGKNTCRSPFLKKITHGRKFIISAKRF